MPRDEASHFNYKIVPPEEADFSAIHAAFEGVPYRIVEEQPARRVGPQELDSELADSEFAAIHRAFAGSPYRIPEKEPDPHQFEPIDVTSEFADIHRAFTLEPKIRSARDTWPTSIRQTTIELEESTFGEPRLIDFRKEEDCECRAWVCCLPPTLHILYVPVGRTSREPGMDVASLAGLSTSLADFVQRRFMINFNWSTTPDPCSSTLSGESCDHIQLPTFTLEPGARDTLRSIKRNIIQLVNSSFGDVEASRYFDDEVRHNAFVGNLRPSIATLQVCAKFGILTVVDDCGEVSAKYSYRFVCDQENGSGDSAAWTEANLSLSSRFSARDVFDGIDPQSGFRGLSFSQRLLATMLANSYLNGYDPCELAQIFQELRTLLKEIHEGEIQGRFTRELLRQLLSLIPGASLALFLIAIIEYELEHGPMDEWSEEVWRRFVIEILAQLGVHIAASAFVLSLLRRFFSLLRSRLPRIRPQRAQPPAPPTPPRVRMGDRTRVGDDVEVTAGPPQPRPTEHRRFRDEERRLRRAAEVHGVQRAAINVMCKPKTQLLGQPAGAPINGEFDALSPNGDIVEVGGSKKIGVSPQTHYTRDGQRVVRRQLTGLNKEKQALICCLMSYGFTILFMLERDRLGMPSDDEIREINLAIQEVCGLDETPDMVRVFN